MSSTENVRVMLEIFSAIERRDPQRVFELCEPDVQFLWPPSLPYGGASPGSAWAETWVPLQPTEAERKMDPRVVAAGSDAPVLGVYQLPTGKLARAQMFYFDTAAVNDFLARAKSLVPGVDPRGRRSSY